MTKDEAREILQKDGCGYGCFIPSRKNCNSTDCLLKEAVTMAIKSLEQQTCEDAVSREAVLGLFAQNADAVRPYSKTWEEVKALPSVNPQSKWIPVSERLPEENKTVIASTKFGVYPEARYTKEDGWEWAYESGADYWEELNVTVTAWMPLPKPYEPQESEVKE